MKKILSLMFFCLFVFSCSIFTNAIINSENTIADTIESNVVYNDTGDSYPNEIGEIKIAKWQGNKKAGLLMLFDDSTYGQAEIAIPFLNKLKLVGTFFVNTGSKPYNDNKHIWEFVSQKRGGGCQELANHTMHHRGAKNENEAHIEIGEPSRIIWKARGESENGSLIAFNKGGGTGWNISKERIAEILKQYNNIDRLNNYIGEPMIGTQILPGSDAGTILRNRTEALNERKILMLSFHGIAKENGNPPKDWGNGAVYVNEFKSAMNILKAQENLFWSAGYIQMHQYIWERKTSTVKVNKTSTGYTVYLSCEKPVKYYNEPLTLLMRIPHEIQSCKITQNGKTVSIGVEKGKLKFNAVPNKKLPIKIQFSNIPTDNKAVFETKPKKDTSTVSIKTAGSAFDLPYSYVNIKPDFVVAVNGNDSNPGTARQPLRTIAKAISKLSSGGVILIKDGNYKEYVNIKKSGTKSKPIRIISEHRGKAKIMGFRILQANSNIVISGFEIESDMAYPNDKKGVMNYGGNNIEISDCYIHDCPTGGISVLKNASNNIIRNNILDHNGFYGILFDGNNGLIENNLIKNIVQNHPKLKPSEIPPGADADGIVIFGHHHIIRRNKILDLASPDSENKNPHSDGIQSSSNATNTVLQDSEIYQNYIRISYKSGKGVILEANKSHPCKNIIIANNIMEFRDIGVCAVTNGGSYRNIKIYNNIFKSGLNQKPWGTAVWLRNIKGYEFINNITIDCKNEHRKITGGNGIVDYNLCYNSNGTSFSLTPRKQSNEIIGVNPQFKNYTGVHGKNDYRLKVSSPAINTGKSLKGGQAVSEDFSGKKRSGKWCIGAIGN